MQVNRLRLVPWRRLVSFGALPLVSALAPMLVLPSLTRALGPDGWAGIAIGQGVGVFAMTLTASGWGTVGPTILARTGVGEWANLYRCSFTSRLIMAALTWPVCSATAAVLAPEGVRVAAAIMAAGMGVWGLTPDWHCVATGNARRMAMYVTFPKTGATLVAAAGLCFIRLTWLFPAVMLLVGLASAMAALWRFGHGGTGWRFTEAKMHLRDHAALNGSRVATTAFTSLAIPLVAIVSPTSVPAYAAVDRLRSIGATGLSAVVAGLQGWIYEGSSPSPRRQRLALAVVSAVGLVGAVSMVALRPILVAVLFGGVADPTIWAFGFQAGALMMIALGSSLTYHFAAPAGLMSAVVRSAWLGSLLGTLGLVTGARAAGGTGAAVAILVAECGVSAVLAMSIVKRSRLGEVGRPC